MIGVYLLSQLCIVATYWAVFQLGRATIGDRHAVLAVLLMAGISVFTIGSPDFGPDILMMPLWAFAILHLWRATGEDKANCTGSRSPSIFWLMLLTSHLALLLFAVVVAFVLINPRARKSAANPAAGMAAITVACMMLPNAALIQQYGFGLHAGPGATAQDRGRRSEHYRLAAAACAGGRRACRRRHPGGAGKQSRAHETDEAAAVRWAPVEPVCARSFIYCFALAPLIVVTAFAVMLGKAGPVAAFRPLLVLSGLAIVVAGRRNHHAASSAHSDHRLDQPADRAGRADGGGRAAAAGGVRGRSADRAAGRRDREILHRQFRAAHAAQARRRGRRSPAGDADIGVTSTSRPRVLSRRPKAGRPQLATRQDSNRKKARSWCGAATDNAGTPPPQVKAQFPEDRAGSAARLRSRAARPRAGAAHRLGRGAAASGERPAPQ